MPLLFLVYLALYAIVSLIPKTISTEERNFVYLCMVLLLEFHKHLVVKNTYLIWYDFLFALGYDLQSS